MSLQFAVFNKCRACLTPETIVEFIHLTGPNAHMFKVVTGIELPIESDKGDSMICPECFNALERLYNFKVMAKQAEIFFELKRRLAPVLQKFNEETKQAAAAQAHTKPQNDSSTASIECDFVVEGFENKGGRRTPMRKNPSELKFRCSKCGSEFKTKQNLLQHSRSKTIHKCAACDVKFSCKLLLDRHQSEFHGNVFKCNKCSYQSRRKGNFLQHEGTHDKPFACETCKKKFSANRSLNLHQMQHRHGIYATAPEETFDCDKCDQWFSRSDCLKQHQRNVHRVEEVKCEVCDKICKNQTSLFRHSRSHVKVECSVCHKTILKNSLALHMQSHSAGNIFQCDFCNYSTRAKGNLKHHIERMHLLRKLVKDSKCRKEFSDFELLEKLQLMHGSSATSSENKFKCDQCSKAFVNLYNLNRHKKAVHAGKLLECQICKKKVRKYRLKSHMKFHSTFLHI